MRWVPFAAFLLSHGVAAATAADVERSVEIARSPAEVWAAAGPFCSVKDWHPDIVECDTLTVEGKPHRRMKLKAGDALLERELERDEAGMSYRYTIERSPLPLSEYRSTFMVEPAGAGARVTWKSDFTADAERRAALQNTVGGLYEAGLQGLKAKLER